MITPLRERVNVGDAPLAHLPFYQQSPQLANTRGVSLSPSEKKPFFYSHLPVFKNRNSLPYNDFRPKIKIPQRLFLQLGHLLSYIHV
jgi:hypothetical protein